MMSKKVESFRSPPTGRQHLGNYLGAMQNYVALQQDYDCIPYHRETCTPSPR